MNAALLSGDMLPWKTCEGITSLIASWRSDSVNRTPFARATAPAPNPGAAKNSNSVPAATAIALIFPIVNTYISPFIILPYSPVRAQSPQSPERGRKSPRYPEHKRLLRTFGKPLAPAHGIRILRVECELPEPPRISSPYHPRKEVARQVGPIPRAVEHERAPQEERRGVCA